MLNTALQQVQPARAGDWGALGRGGHAPPSAQRTRPTSHSGGRAGGPQAAEGGGAGEGKWGKRGWGARLLGGFGQSRVLGWVKKWALSFHDYGI